MAIKDIITDIKGIISGLINEDSISEITSRLSSLLSLALLVIKKQLLVNNEAKLNRLKYLKKSALYSDLVYVKTLLELAKNLLLKLNKYRTNAINEKKVQNQIIKNLIDTKLSDPTKKDYQKYKNIEPHFNFNDLDDEATLDSNIKAYNILDAGETFGIDRINNWAILPKSNKVDTNPSDDWRSRIKK